MKLLKGTAVIDRDFAISRIDPRLYGGFIEHMGRCVYGGIYDPAHPEAGDLGFRRDVLELVRQLDVPIIRYPGGNFVSGFCWEDSVGPVSERPVRRDLAWKSIEPNLVGLDEFYRWSSQAGSEVMMAVNLGTRGVQEAAQLLEYCRSEGETHYGELRKRHGREEPYPFRVWCLGNEMDGPWQICNKSAIEYGTLAREAGKVMKRLDPSLELVACGSSSLNLPTYPDWDATVLEACYEYADYLSVHMYLNNKENDLETYLGKSLRMDEYIRSILAACDYVKAKKRSRKTMHLSFDEWNVEPGTWKGNTAEPWTVGPALCEGSFTMADAVVFGTMMMSLIKHSDRIRIACLAQLVNVFGLVMTDPGSGKAWRQSVYYPFQLTSRYGRGTALPVRLESPTYRTPDDGEVPLLEAVSVWNEGQDELTLFIASRSLRDNVELELELRGFDGCGWTAARCLELYDEDPNAINSAGDPERIVPREGDAIRLQDNRLRLQLRPVSWNMVRIGREKVL